ncbi:Beta-glucuronidase [Dirofilaria immitis]|nr:Beta-glucuronidase [Dirofilaria immitis]
MDICKRGKNSPSIGIKRKWHLYDLSNFENATVMPVPAAYNDLTADRQIREHVGWFINDKIVGIHIGGHLPFEIDITNQILFDGENRLTVAVNNTMTSGTIPPGEFRYIQKEYGGSKQYSEGFFKQTWNFDFFNYAGILRPVYIIRKPFAHIEDISIEAEANGTFRYKVYTISSSQLATIQVTVIDRYGIVIFKSNQQGYSGHIDNIQPWWPRDMGAPVLYNFVVQLSISGILIDVYRLWFGFRTISLSENQTFINGKPFYCHGFGMHEDFELHGRGYNPVVLTKDLNMLEWMNGNCYRTSHYPYSEEMAFEADRRGIAVITETPAVGLSYFTKQNQLLHAEMIRELIERDRNHPSTIMWSLANEPASSDPAARLYFSELINLTRSIDRTRPITAVLARSFDADQVAGLLDLICINRYFGWYIDIGYLETVNHSWIFEMKNWKSRYNKPIIVAEYGAEALPGLNQEPSRVFSEQYQRELLEQTHHAFDILRKNHIITGEMIWNLADFMTADGVTRAVGNHKGVLTRNRQPKMAAYILKKRYKNLEEITT